MLYIPQNYSVIDQSRVILKLVEEHPFFAAICGAVTVVGMIIAYFDMKNPESENFSDK